MASESSSSSSSMQLAWKYDVFLSFRGEDVRMNFVDHLSTAMFSKGFDIFKDDVALKRGEYITPTLLAAIENSRVTVVVLSKRYADSSFCLIELAKIMECNKKRGQIILPVFYGVDASDVRKQSGAFGAGFAKHTKDSRVNEWRQALVDVAEIAGWGPNRYEVKMIEEIIETISLGRPWKTKNSTVYRNLIGIEPRMQCVKSLMEIESGTGVRMIGIWGIGGGGKTTLATAIYNEVNCMFDGRCSLVENIKEEPLNRDVFKERYLKLGSINEGKCMIEERMCRFRVLIVLDDVNHGSQLEALAGSHGWFGPGSRIIITTRNKNLLEAHGVDSIHEVNLLKDWEAIQLFNRYAFRNKQPSKVFEELSLNVVRYTCGLPLALKVLGSSLCNKKFAAWKSALERLKDMPNKDIFEILKISYDCLQPDEQEMFLDIACFLRGREKDEVLEMLNARGFHTDILLDVLIDNSLVRVSNGNLQMHDLVQEMGHWIVRKEHNKHSRIWQAGELLKICTGDTPMKKKVIKGIQVRFDDECPIDFSDAFTDMVDLQFLDISIFPLWKDVPDVKEPNVLPDSLQWLSWSNYPGKSLSPGFKAKNLAGICVTSSKIVQLWEEDKVIDKLSNLKMLDLSGSKYLTRSESFFYTDQMESESDATQLSWNYDVFFSFRRKDTRNNIVEDLCRSLSNRGINVYEDNIAEFHQGKETILAAMERSRFVIVVISKNYLRSTWCMNELAQIMATRTGRRRIVIPVLYNIKHTEVFSQAGPLGASFDQMLRRYERWRKWLLPLQEASGLAGWTNISYRQKSIEEIVDIISRGVSSSQANYESNLIGVEPHMQHIIKDLLKIGSGGVRMIGICGVGGIGKTTLAMAVYNEISCKFGGRCCFIESLKEYSRKNGLKKLQEKILTDVFKASNMTLMSTDEGKRMIKERMGRFSVLIVLDDVDDSSQLAALVGKRSWFGMGSRIIITARDKCLLEAHEVDSIHQVDLLKDGEAVDLFNSYAFPKNKTLKETREENDKLSVDIVHAAGSLPLTLKVLGSFLCDKMEYAWTSALEDLKLASTETSKKLKISYNGLRPDEKEIFLDIALFFRNRKKAEVLEILYACGDQTCDIGVDVLIKKSLISVSDGHFQVHDLIQEMARAINLEELPKEHGRIWQAEELLKKTEATKVTKIKGIQVRFEDERPIDFSDAFTNMKDLRFLDISISQMSKDRADDKEPKVLPNNLRWLSWSNYPGKRLPRDFQAKELVVLFMTCSKIVSLSMEHKLFGLTLTLKMLDLSGSKDLISIPSFATFPNLERLILQNCHNLKLVDPSIGNLGRLVSLDMSGCSELQAFPPIIRMTSLKFLIFSGCTKLTTFPEIQGNIDRLEHLWLQNSGIQNLPNPIGQISSLISIDVRDCKSLTSMSFEFHQLISLRSLKVSGCSRLEKLPESLGDLQFMEELLLDNTGIRELPAFIWNMMSLRTLSFRHIDKVGTSKMTKTNGKKLLLAYYQHLINGGCYDSFHE
ncbi:TMV resistance protein N-like [Cynara cardunculus var. scolymus]|uniref:TMV resistance protein N-like n=1 Tax=Cynara cardunculus var. scolymus TaxID=59895 RepID=UPI000D62C066|nr:TMV resistance protein N-like [Cynara cardunculus var. scolymus]